jgi:hypothetical protein
MNATALADTAFLDQVGQRLLLKLGGRHFLVDVLERDDHTFHVSFPGSDFPLEGTTLDFEHHDDTGVILFRARVVRGARRKDEGLLLERPAQGYRRTHRDAFRVPTDLTALIRDQAHQQRYSAEVVNLSSGGALLQADAPFDQDSMLAVSLPLPRECIRSMAGEVVHMRWRQSTHLAQKKLLGVRFVGTGPEVRRTLSHYIGERLRHLSTVD